MRSWYFSAIVLFLALILMGMGGLGGDPEGVLPETEHDFAVTVVDRSGVATSLTRFSMDGSTFFHGQLGSASVTIDFADIQSIAFSSITNDRITVKLDLKRGEDLGLKIRRRSGFAGQMNVGVYRILAEEVSRIDFK